jgi:hypothetical protein
MSLMVIFHSKLLNEQSWKQDDIPWLVIKMAIAWWYTPFSDTPIERMKCWNDD